ncbi:Universal stress protein family protein [Dyella sp. OK004]|uniref:universal stress protein n=1 Tax=Dyella sp. OK004 TaxID=1855292 RepID=UPI0008EC1B42|nr:universal stress protein [Dyella sp. OK004]SFS13961.1 Universal stress protein family protein [Dyella sp. OK004]
MRDVLVYSESYKVWSPGVEYAARLATAFDAHLTGIWICPSPSAAIPAFEAPELLALLFETTRQLEDEAFAAGPPFVDYVHKLGVHKTSWQVAEGYVPDTLALASRYHDLLVIDCSNDTPWGSLSAVGNIVMGSGIPSLVVPPGQLNLPALDTVAIAWNGSAEALHAVHAALPLLARALRVVILHGEQQQPISMLSWRPPFDLASYLLRHGIAAESKRLNDGNRDIGATLLAAAGHAGATLLVMGAYGHTRFSEWVLGGATRSVLEQATIPVLMLH